MRDLRTVNMSVGQKAESEKVFKRIGDVDYRNLGTFSKILFNTGKVAVMSGLRVEESSGMTVKIPAGILIQRNSSGENFPVIMTDDILVTMDAASGISRTDIIECQVKSVAVKDDYAQSVLDPQTGIISMEPIKRDIKYYLDARKKTGSTTPTVATAATLIGTAEIISSVDLSSRYIINLIDGEDGNSTEIDLRGATPEATTKAEIVAAINAAIGRTGASVIGNYIAMTGDGTGIQSFFEFKPPVTDTDLDCLDLVFGLGIGGLYSYQYHGSNDWFKICEIDVGAASVVITNAMIRNIDEKSTWASDASETHIGLSIYNADLLDGYHANTGAVAGTVPVRDANGKIPGSITGDSETVGGNAGTDVYARRTHTAKFSTASLPESTNINDIAATGWYQGTNLTNAPDSSWFFIEHLEYSGNGYKRQIAHKFFSGESYMRRCDNGTWSAWVKLFTSTMKAAAAERVSADVNAHIDAAGVYATYFNYFSGEGGVIFCDGHNNVVGTVSGAGLANFNRGLKNTLYVVSWTIGSLSLGTRFYVYQPVVIIRTAGTGAIGEADFGFAIPTNASFVYTLVPGRYIVIGGSITFAISYASSQTQSDIITVG